MKRVVALGFVSLLLAFGLFACSNDDGQMTQEEMIASAQNLDMDAFNSLDSENAAKAQQEYDGKVFKYTACVDTIRTDKVLLGTPWNVYYANPIYVELSTEEMASLNKGDEITVVGIMRYEESNISTLTDAFIVNE